MPMSLPCPGVAMLFPGILEKNFNLLGQRYPVHNAANQSSFDSIYCIQMYATE